MMDKQQAITWLEQIKVKYIHGGDEQFDDCRRESIDMAIQALRQPQIVRCKDCKHYIHLRTDPGYCTRDGSRWVFRDLDWFCADGERRGDSG